MKQPVKRGKTVHGKKPKVKERLRKPNGRLERQHPKYGISKLELDFAHNFLEPLGIKFIYQYFASQIGRYYDFAIISNDEKNLEYEIKDGLKSVKQEGQVVPITILIECDGSYYHSDPRLVKEDEMNPMQKKNKMVDEIKNRWALLHSIPIVRFWEKDIRENPSMVMKQLKERLYIEGKAQNKKKERNKRHRNILK